MKQHVALAALLAITIGAAKGQDVPPVPVPDADRPTSSLPSPPTPSKSMPAPGAPKVAEAPKPETPSQPSGGTPAAADRPGDAAVAPTVPPEDDELELVFAYGSEKQKWIEAVTRRFNDSRPRLASGRPFRVAAAPVGSGELIDEVLTARRKAHLVSPAAAAFILIGNAASREQGKGDLIGPTRELVSSPIVVAMWREMAEAAGWPNKELGWGDIFGLARDPERWKAIAKPEWGAFRLAHTEPDKSNSGLHALMLEIFAAAGKFEGMTRADLKDHPEVGRYLREVEKAVPYYETSTGFLARRMVGEGSARLSAAVLYENLVIEANQEARRRDPTAELPRVVAIYPAEGTFPCEHPAGVVLRDWVTPDHREAAEAYLAFLTARPQQEEARRSGFRPADRSIDPGDLLAPEMGVDPAQPRRLLRPPPTSAINLIRDLWRSERNPDAGGPSTER